MTPNERNDDEPTKEEDTQSPGDTTQGRSENPGYQLVRDCVSELIDELAEEFGYQLAIELNEGPCRQPTQRRKDQLIRNVAREICRELGRDRGHELERLVRREFERFDRSLERGEPDHGSVRSHSEPGSPPADPA